MTHTPHELSEEFPEHAGTIHRLKEADPHFARLYADYHEVNRAVHRAETLVEPTAEAREEDLRKQRMVLKDQLFAMLQKA
jgi:uncharacterized protein YdcH (DUF465 family)